MANEQEYYNPIIKGMVATVQAQQQAEKLKQEQEVAKQQVASQKISDEQHKRQLDLAELSEQHHNEHEQQTIDIHKALADVQSKIGGLQRIKTVREMIMGGLNQNQINSNLPADQQIQGELPSTDSLVSQEANRVKQTAAASAEGALPSQQKLLEQQGTQAKSLKQMEEDFQSRLTDKKIASEEKIAGLTRNTQLAISNAANATHLKVAGMDSSYAPNQQVLKSMVIGGLTGQVKLNPGNPLERQALSSVIESGGRPIEKNELDALKQGQALIPLFDKLKAFADKLPSSKSGAFVQGQGIGLANKLGWPSETQNEINKISSQALVIGRAIEGMTGGRMSVKQLELDLNSLASGGIPKDQAISRLDNLKDLYTNRQENVIMGGMPDFQKELIYKTQGIEPSWLATAPQKSAKGHKLDKDESIKAGRPVYTE